MQPHSYPLKESIFLTGGTGFFGRSLLRYWIKKEGEGIPIQKIIILSRSPEQFLETYPEFNGHAWLIFHKGDVLIPKSLPQNESFSHIIHAATDSTHGLKLDPISRFDQIVTGTRNILDYSVQIGAKRLLLTSSGGVYGEQPLSLGKISEDYYGMANPLVSQNTYSVAKRVAEHLCALYSDKFGLETVVARCFAFVGRDLPLDAHFAIGNFIRDALWKDEIVVKGNGLSIRTYLDQEDLAHWLNVLLYNGKPNEAYNVGSDQEITTKELAFLIRDLVSPEKKVTVLENKNYNTRNRYVPDIKKALNNLKLELNYKLEESIIRVYNIYKKKNM